MIPLKRGLQYQLVRKRGKGDELIELKLSPPARRKWADGPERIKARLVSKEVNGKTVQMLTSMPIQLYDSRFRIS